MDIIEKINLHKDKFITDPLYQRLNNDGLLEDLFATQEYFEKISLSDTYSSKQAADLLNESNSQTLVNFINRYDLNKYLNVFRRENTRFYRYDWESLFKFKMILLLTEHKYTPLDIADFIGTRTSVSESDTFINGYSKKSPRNEEIESSEIKSIISTDRRETVNAILGNFLAYDEIRQSKEDLIRDSNLVETDLKLWGEKMNTLIDRLDELERYKRILELQKPVPVKGLFAKLFTNEADIKDKQKVIDSELKDLESKFTLLEEKRLMLLKEKEELINEKQTYVFEEAELLKAQEAKKELLLSFNTPEGVKGKVLPQLTQMQLTEKEND
ncbi:MAG: hypothetical protein R3267_02310 [Paenisporosarcina sp.]|nr:hypothetical protein [Paenisporosarcina sp.]